MAHTLSRPAPLPATELPAPGYPPSEDALDHWFRQRYGRAPTEQELGAVMAAMAKRDSTPPHDSDASELETGWLVGPSPSRPGPP